MTIPLLNKYVNIVYVYAELNLQLTGKAREVGHWIDLYSYLSAIVS